jgi:hypothetical protein
MLAGLLTYGMLAHHGGTGAGYDTSNPVYVRGRIIQARYGFPHGTMRVEVPADVTVPRNLPGVQNLAGYENWRGRPAAEGAGEVRELLLFPDVTSELAGMRGAPGVGDEVAAVAYRRCPSEGDQYAGELRVQLLYAVDRSFRYRINLSRLVDRCLGATRPTGSPAADEGPPYLLVGGGAVVAVGFVAALIRLRMRRANGESPQ